MGRFLVLVLIVVAVVWLARRAFRAPGAEEVARKPAVEGDLVSCARCGMHLPRSEAREASGALYCGEEHARLGRGGPG